MRKSIADTAEYHRRWYHANKDKRRETIKEYQERTKQVLRELKDMKPCTDCAIPYAWYIMQWDHTSTDKLFNISSGRRKGINTVLKEIQKCELVCANCHAERTYIRAQKVE